MTDKEFAACVYEKLKLGQLDRMSEKGVLDAIGKLDEQLQRILELYLRQNMTFKQVGDKIGISQGMANYNFNKALLKLKHPYNCRKMRVS